MQTSLPDLPFTTYGDAEFDPTAPHSASKSKPRRYPRTDLQTLTPWTSFLNEIDQRIRSATTLSRLTDTTFTVKCWDEPNPVTNEETIRAHAMLALHVAVQKVLEKLGVIGRFTVPGSGNSAIVGDPDFSWIENLLTRPHPKLVVEYKTWWVTNLLDLLAAFNGTSGDARRRQSLEALEQIYGYMTFNNNKFGILTNWKRSVFLRRSETSGRKTLEYHVVELNRLGYPISMLKAWVGMVLLAQDDWFYASPTPCSGPPGQHFTLSVASLKDRKAAVDNAERYRSSLDNGKYRCRPIDFRLCHFECSSARHGARGCVVYGRLLSQYFLTPDLEVIFKIVDVLRYSDTATLLHREARAYADLRDLQGEVIPKLYGFYSVWGLLHLLALQPVGNSIPEDEQINRTLRTKMRAALRRIHGAGFVHGDIARRNFCRMGGDIFLVDLETCRRSQNQSESDDEMDEVDRL